MDSIKIIVTKDGSKTLYNNILDETYHSRNGAITESEFVYIKEGLQHYHNLHALQERIDVLEFGFGTGLNALLSFLWAENNNVGIDYVSIEKNPIDLSLAIETGYGLQKDSPILFNTLHATSWNEKQQLSANFSLTKIKQDFLDLEKSEAYDVLFYDAFAPSKQAEVWNGNYLELARNVLRKNGMLVTYSAQGQFKRTLKQVGFKVEVIKGPPGKREMIRAFKL